eukprot:6186743-Pleurochrysis_carterae.AAC.1
MRFSCLRSLANGLLSIRPSNLKQYDKRTIVAIRGTPRPSWALLRLIRARTPKAQLRVVSITICKWTQLKLIYGDQ